MQRAKRQKINQAESSHLIQHTSQQGHELVIEGARFQLREDGSKLVRVSGECGTDHVDAEYLQLNRADNPTNMQTPKTAKVAGVDFYRTKHGNLVRANAVKGITRYLSHNFPMPPDQDQLIRSSRTSRPTTTPQCEHFTKNGNYPPSASGLNDLYHINLAQICELVPLLVNTNPSAR